MTSVAEIWDMLQRGVEDVEMPDALLLFDAWPVDDGAASFRTRVAASPSARVVDGHAQVAWIRKRSEGVFSGLIGIGRTRNNDIVLPMAGVSKYHAYIQQDIVTGVYSIADAGSKNGTLVDGSVLAPRKPVELQDNALVSFAGNGCRFRLTPAFLASVAATPMTR